MQKVEAKVVAATLGSTVISTLIAVLNVVSNDSNLISDLPLWAQFIMLVVIPPVITFWHGYQMSSKTSTVSDKYNANSSR
jgi:type VI protein secretion system component VasF